MSNNVVVGIGFSAGGLPAATTFFDQVPHDEAIYIITRHIPINHRSELHHILQLHSKLTIIEATNDLKVEKDFVYIPPSDKVIIMKGDRICLINRLKGFIEQQPIDLFLDSLAKSKGKRSVAIILSGTGSDGLLGAKAIRRAGGIVMVQSPDTCEYDFMPKNIIVANLADFVLKPADKPPDLLGHVSHIVINDNLADNLLGRV